MYTGFVLATLLAHTVPCTADLSAYLRALREGRSEPEICALTGPALDNYDSLLDRGFDAIAIGRVLGDLADPRRPLELRARLIETAVACGQTD